MIRELFVELGEAAMAALRAQAEQAVKKSYGVADVSAIGPMYKQLYARRLYARYVSEQYVSLLYDRYGWRYAEVMVLAGTPRRDLIATLHCGHRATYRVDDLEARRAATPADELDMLDRIVAEQGTRCFCVRRPK